MDKKVESKAQKQERKQVPGTIYESTAAYMYHTRGIKSITCLLSTGITYEYILFHIFTSGTKCFR